MTPRQRAHWLYLQFSDRLQPEDKDDFEEQVVSMLRDGDRVLEAGRRWLPTMETKLKHGRGSREEIDLAKIVIELSPSSNVESLLSKSMLGAPSCGYTLGGGEWCHKPEGHDGGHHES